VLLYVDEIVLSYHGTRVNEIWRWMLGVNKTKKFKKHWVRKWCPICYQMAPDK